MKFGLMTGLLMGLLLLSLCAGIFSVMFIDGFTNYNVSDYNDSKFTAYKRTQAVVNITNETAILSGKTEERPGSAFLDVLGSFFRQGKLGLDIASDSVVMVNEMGRESVGTLGLGEGASIYYAFIGALIAVLTVMLILSIFLKPAGGL